LDFERGKSVTIFCDGKAVEAFEGETIAAALHAAGIRVLSHSIVKDQARGLFCAIGNCSSCFMIVDGKPNVKTCMTTVKEGMRVETQKGISYA
jgi:predicted molibdopterin-dependent oxidoreductase YjgC